MLYVGCVGPLQQCKVSTPSQAMALKAKVERLMQVQAPRPASAVLQHISSALHLRNGPLLQALAVEAMRTRLIVCQAALFGRHSSVGTAPMPSK